MMNYKKLDTKDVNHLIELLGKDIQGKISVKITVMTSWAASVPCPKLWLKFSPQRMCQMS